MVNMLAMLCVNIGVVFLDKEKPGWREHVDPAKLDMRDPKNCILGQVFREDGIKKTAYWQSIMPPQEKGKPPPPPPRKINGYDYARLTFPELALYVATLGFEAGVVDLASLEEAWLEVLNG